MDNDAVIPVTGGDEHKVFMQQWLDTDESISVDPGSTCAHERGIDSEEGFASRFYSTCRRGLQQLCLQEQKGYAPGSQSYLLKEELGKLYLWGEGFAPGELDKALGESEEVRDNVLDLLVNLGELIIRELRASSTVARGGQVHELRPFIEQARLITSDDDGQVDLDTLDSDTKCLNRDDYSDDGAHDFCEDVVFTIKCLTELGPSLEQNLASAERSDPSTSKSAFAIFYLSGPAGFYVSLVRDKFKQASTELVERLGEANWQRHVKIRNMMEGPEKNPAKGQEIARSIFQADTTFHDSGIGTSVPAGTQYAPSHTSFRTSNTGGGVRSLRVPPTPREATDGKSFRCYLCGHMLSTIRTRTQWKMHVFSDLMPYICTFDECQHKLRCFQSRSTWADHEFKEHRFDRYWACPECSARSCSTLDWEHHLNDVHNQKFSGPNLVLARNTACRISPKRAEEEQCPLCRVVLGKPRRAFVKHVSRHMEDIALMALPSNAEEDSEIGSISTSHTLDEDNEPRKDLNTDKDYTIKCICGFGDDDGNTVYCKRCNTWQHTECFYQDENGIVPTKDVLRSIDHLCADCKPKPLDARGSPDYLPPPARSPAPERTSRMKRMVRMKWRERKLRSIQDLIEGRGEPLYQENDESTDENEVKSDTSGHSTLSLRTAVAAAERGKSPKDYQYGPSDNESTEAPHLETPNGGDPLMLFGFPPEFPPYNGELPGSPKSLVSSTRAVMDNRSNFGDLDDPNEPFDINADEPPDISQLFEVSEPFDFSPDQHPPLETIDNQLYFIDGQAPDPPVKPVDAKPPSKRQ